MIIGQVRDDKMKTRITVIIALAILIGSFGVGSKLIQTRAALTIRVPVDYPTIQGAVDAANPGDTIWVANGTYHERVTLYKDGLSLLGENPKTTIVDSGFIDQPICITANNICISGFTMRNGGRCGIYLDRTGNVTLVWNIIANNTSYGIYLDNSVTSVISENTIENNWQGILLWYSDGNIIYHNEFNNTIQASVEASTSTWDNGYPSGGNYWSDYNGIDVLSGSYQKTIGSDGIGDIPQVVDYDNVDHYPLVKPYPWDSHDIGVTYIGKVSSQIVVPIKTVIGQGFVFSFNVFVMNYGSYPEVFNVTVCINATLIGAVTNIALASRNSVVLEFTWDTKAFVKGKYILSAYATLVLGETNTTDNTRTGGIITVTIPGDVDGNFRVDGSDLALLGGAWFSKSGDANWNPNADINDDDQVTGIDLAILAGYWFQTDP